jgi:hypothetical protein
MSPDLPMVKKKPADLFGRRVLRIVCDSGQKTWVQKPPDIMTGGIRRMRIPHVIMAMVAFRVVTSQL